MGQLTQPAKPALLCGGGPGPGPSISLWYQLLRGAREASTQRHPGTQSRKRGGGNACQHWKVPLKAGRRNEIPGGFSPGFTD